MDSVGVWRNQQSIKSGHTGSWRTLRTKVTQIWFSKKWVWWHRKFWSWEMTSGKLVWNFLKTISCIFLFAPSPLVPATNLSPGYSDNLLIWLLPAPSPFSTWLAGRTLQNVNHIMLPPCQNLQSLILHLW